jgi:MFS superfamily sulfate permease-like transporter
MVDAPKNFRWPIFRSLQGFSASALHYDLLAGLTLAAIAIPEQMATARLGGFPPHIGFFAFVAGSIAFAIFGSNRFLSSGADSTITPIFAGALALIVAGGTPEYAQLAAILALLIGALLALAGLLRAGWVADLLSIPVMTGFLAGISIHIAISQAPALLGLPAGHGEIFARLAQISHDFGKTSTLSLAIGVSCLAFIVISEKISPRIPGALIALATATFVVSHFHLDARGIAVVGAFKVAPPHPSIPSASLDQLSHVMGLAVVISMIIMVQTAATSRSFPGAPGETPDVDRDFIGLGAGSALAGLFGAFPVNASPPRTAIVAETGGRSQIAGLVACVVIVATSLYGADLLAKVPTTALAGVLLFVAGRIFRVGEMRDIGGKTKAEFALILVTMLAVVFLPVQTGVALAIMLSLIHGVFTTTRTRLIEFERLPGSSVWWPESRTIAGEKLLGVLVVAFQAPLSFLNAYQFQHDLQTAIERAGEGLRLVVLEASSIVEIDFTAARILNEAIAQCRDKKIDFAVARLESVRAQEALEKFGVFATLGEGRVFHSVDDATRKLAPAAAGGADAETAAAG